MEFVLAHDKHAVGYRSTHFAAAAAEISFYYFSVDNDLMSDWYVKDILRAWDGTQPLPVAAADDDSNKNAYK